MRTIKFRGVTPDALTVYGDLTHFNGNTFIDDKRVEPETVTQLCGYDSNDNEVYEGDFVIAHGKEYPVSLVPKYSQFHNLKYCTKK